VLVRKNRAAPSHRPISRASASVLDKGVQLVLEFRTQTGAQTDGDGASGGDGVIGVAPLLLLDRRLGAGLSRSQRADAKRELMARTTLLRPGDSGAELFRTGLFGALVVEGALARRVCTDRGRSLEVIVKGDLLRPWQEDSGWVIESTIDALVTTRVAVIDRFAGDSLCKFPPVIEALLERAFRRIRSMATQAAFDSRAGMDQRVLASMRHLADRCGEKGADGVVIPLPLTHQMIADLLGAQRPSVSAAISRLSAEGMMRRTDGRGWVLRPESDRLLTGRR
jgi:CRP/FNR family transcriptional regulator, cyclic AMP receptor protein